LVQTVWHRMAGEPHLTRVGGNRGHVLRIMAQGAGYGGFRLPRGDN
jgi:hypothetical protein